MTTHSGPRLEARLRGHEARLERTEDDLTAISDTVIETRDDVRALNRKVDRITLAVAALLEHAGLTMPPEPTGSNDHK